MIVWLKQRKVLGNIAELKALDEAVDANLARQKALEGKAMELKMELFHIQNKIDIMERKIAREIINEG
jgi:hypothetical protein